MKYIFKLLISAAIILGAAFLLPGIFIKSFGVALLVMFVLSILNVVLRPVLILLTIPVTILTLGLFLLVINTVIILLTDWMIDGFEVRNFWWALLFSLIVSLVNYLADLIIGD
jgi:putative membrane protein